MKKLSKLFLFLTVLILFTVGISSDIYITNRLEYNVFDQSAPISITRNDTINNSYVHAGTETARVYNIDNILTVSIENRYVYKNVPFNIKISKQEDIEHLYYVVLPQPTDEYPYNFSATEGYQSAATVKSLDSSESISHISINTEDLWHNYYEVQIAVKTKDNNFHKGITIDFVIIPKPKVIVEYNRHNWETEQKITIKPQYEWVERIEYIDPSGNIQQLVKEDTADYPSIFSFKTTLPEPESYGTFVFTSDKGLVHEDIIKTYKERESRVFFQGKRYDMVDGKSKPVYCVLSNSLDGKNLEVEFDIPVFKFEDEYFSSFMDSLDPKFKKYDMDTDMKGSKLTAISPNKQFYLFSDTQSLHLAGSNIVHGRNVRRICISLFIIYDAYSDTYEYINRGYYYEFFTAKGEGTGVIWDDFIRTKPLYWKSNTKLIMLESVAKDRLWSQYEATNDPELKTQWTLYPPDPNSRIISLNIADRTITEIDGHEALKPEIKVSDDTTGITGWYSPFDQFSNARNLGFFYISDRTGHYKHTEDEILSIAGIPEAERSNHFVLHYGSTNFQNRPRALLLMMNSISREDRESKNMNTGTHYTYCTFDPVSEDLKILYEMNFFPDESNFAGIPKIGNLGIPTALRSCHPDTDMLPLILSGGYFYQFNADGTVSCLSDQSITSSDEFKANGVFFIK